MQLFLGLALAAGHTGAGVCVHEARKKNFRFHVCVVWWWRYSYRYSTKLYHYDYL